MVIGGAILWLLIAFLWVSCAPCGHAALLDTLGMICVLLGMSAHPAWMSLILSWFFGCKRGSPRSAGYCDLVYAAPSATWGTGPVGVAPILPWFAISVLFAALSTPA